MTDKKYKDSAKIVHNFDRNVQLNMFSKTDLATSLNNLPEQLKRPKTFTFWRYDSDQKKPPVNAKGLKHNVHKTNNLISFRQAISQYNPNRIFLQKDGTPVADLALERGSSLHYCMTYAPSRSLYYLLECQPSSEELAAFQEANCVPL